MQQIQQRRISPGKGPEPPAGQANQNPGLRIHPQPAPGKTGGKDWIADKIPPGNGSPGGTPGGSGGAGGRDPCLNCPGRRVRRRRIGREIRLLRRSGKRGNIGGGPGDNGGGYRGDGWHVDGTGILGRNWRIEASAGGSGDLRGDRRDGRHVDRAGLLGWNRAIVHSTGGSGDQGGHRRG